MDFDNEHTTILQNISNFSPNNMALDLNHYFHTDWSIMLLELSDPNKPLHHDCLHILFTLNDCQRPNYLYSALAIKDFIMSTWKHYRDNILTYYTTYMSHLLHEPSEISVLSETNLYKAWQPNICVVIYQCLFLPTIHLHFLQLPLHAYIT
jgi:hypothetical protein